MGEVCHFMKHGIVKSNQVEVTVSIVMEFTTTPGDVMTAPSDKA